MVMFALEHVSDVADALVRWRGCGIWRHRTSEIVLARRRTDMVLRLGNEGDRTQRQSERCGRLLVVAGSCPASVDPAALHIGRCGGGADSRRREDESSIRRRKTGVNSLAITQLQEASGAERAVKVRRPRDSGGGAQRSTLYGAEHRSILAGVMTKTMPVVVTGTSVASSTRSRSPAVSLAVN